MSTITGITRGEAKEIPYTVTVTDILPDTLSKAWLTVKRRTSDSDDDAILQKEITSALTADGQIDQPGSDDDAGHLFFLLSPDDTNAMSSTILYHYDVKALSSGGAPKALDSGRIRVKAAVTQASS